LNGNLLCRIALYTSLIGAIEAFSDSTLLGRLSQNFQIRTSKKGTLIFTLFNKSRNPTILGSSFNDNMDQDGGRGELETVDGLSLLDANSVSSLIHLIL